MKSREELDAVQMAYMKVLQDMVASGQVLDKYYNDLASRCEMLNRLVFGAR